MSATNHNHDGHNNVIDGLWPSLSNPFDKEGEEKGGGEERERW